MFKYSRMREETERILTTYLREQEQICKDHVSLHKQNVFVVSLFEDKISIIVEVDD